MNTQALAARDFSVVWVTLSLRKGPSETVSADNSGRTAYNLAVGTTNLGTFFAAGITNVWVTGVEIVGVVKPSNYQGLIKIERRKVDVRVYNNQTLGGTQHDLPDTSGDSLRDDDPQSGGSSGKVYDVDAPGVGNVPADPLNAIARLRANFRQWAVTLRGSKVSDDMNWFSRVSVIKTANGDVLRNEIAGDNVAGTGTTNLSWNLQ